MSTEVQEDEGDFEVTVDPRESELAPGVVDVTDIESEESEAPTDLLGMFKEKIKQVFDVDDEFLDKLEVREDLEVALADYATRRERLGYKWQPTAEDRKARVPKWAREVQCPKCGNIMIPLKAKRNGKPKDANELNHPKFGETITYQCHATDEFRRPCLAVVVLTTSVGYLMRPADFTPSDWNWMEVAPQTVPMIPGAKVKEIKATVQTVVPEIVPTNPWDKKGAMSYQLWKNFWEIAMRDDGEVGYDELKEAVQKARPQDKTKYLARLKSELDSLPSWMQKRSGYTVKLFGNAYRVVGISKGHLDWFPYSDPEYRKAHGMVGYGFD
ncbi:hypothetical protein [Streptomyces sp. CoH17]|uniref:hypothetical protein n=1 Tax=Streptomyces sp. CoH17 TaxID=2992806 RepID=UPI002270CA5D|nr:hypothetical protein [Streptomyces sp. CoH17]